jgi:hypothetical protein
MSLTEQRVRTEVMKALQAKGYIELADKGESAGRANSASRVTSPRQPNSASPV